MDAYNVGDEDSIELKKLLVALDDDPDNFETWEKLVRCGESLEGGVNRSSGSAAITSVRSIYDNFLSKFPLFFGYWKKYADLEFAIAGTEAAELVYERGISSITNSVDLWTNYCSFKTETSHDPEVIRELYERGANSVGLDFLAHPFWDKYIEFEERQDQSDRIFAILGRVITIPMHQYARYFEKYRNMASTKPLTLIAPTGILTKLQLDLENEGLGYKSGRTQLEVERDLRARIDAHHMTIFQQTQAETHKRWTFESEIKRPYFHVTELEDGQLVNWRKYLDFEESEGDYTRIQFLYERCLISCAIHDEFWMRYARWTSNQPNKQEETRNIYQRASCIFVPIAVPMIRLQYAYFEELHGRVNIAKAIHEAILIQLPGHIETIVSWASTCRRHDGIDAAIAVFKGQLESSYADMPAKAAVLAEWAKLVLRFQGSAEEARQIFTRHQQNFLDSPVFWSSYLRFEINLLSTSDTEKHHHEKIKKVIEFVVHRSRLSPPVIQQLVTMYMEYLLERGSKDAAKEYMELDQAVNGPVSVQKTLRGKILIDQPVKSLVNGQVKK